jgi:hypothetical protein
MCLFNEPARFLPAKRSALNFIHARIRILPRANGSMNDTLKNKKKLCALMPVRFGGASLRTGLLLVPHAQYR